LISEHPLLSNTIAHNLANHIVYLLGLVEDLALRNVDGRLARLLLDRYKDDAINQRKWSTQAEMAACIGTTPVIVSRVLNNFKDRGAIRIEHRQIIIQDHKMLEAIEYREYK
jgi:CRP-like cAMP-binding protein